MKIKPLLFLLAAALLPWAAMAQKTHIANTSSSTAMTWAEFADIVNNGTTYQGMTVYLDEDITATKMVGTDQNNCFKGTFDGQSHSITFNYSNTSEDWCAPFHYLNGTTICNLIINGTITANYDRCGGLAGNCYGTNAIINCLNNITINSTVNGDGTHGGFISRIYRGSTTFEGCTFAGKLLGGNTTANGGFVGWSEGNNNYASVSFSNCIYAPIANTMNQSAGATFARGRNESTTGITINNCFYTSSQFQYTQGSQSYTITGQSPITVGLYGTATNYNASYITAYEGTPGLLYNGTVIAGSGEQVSLNLGGGSHYGADHGTLSGTANPYTLTMEANNTTIIELDAAPYSTDFETNDWTLVNGSCTNKWCWGTAASNGGTHGLYISNNGGTTNAYTINSSAMVYAYKTFHLEAGIYDISYDWKTYGESDYDFLRVALVPASVSLEASTSMPSGFSATTLPEGWIALDGGSQLNLSTDWQNKRCYFTVIETTGEYKMVFAWRNDYSYGNNPPAAIDNVSIIQVTCPMPFDLAADNITYTTAELNWNSLTDMDSYTVRYKATQYIVLSEDFENGLGDWTLRDCYYNTGVNYYHPHSGQNAFRFYYSTTHPQYLISPKLSGVVGGMRLKFYYSSYFNDNPEYFQIGFSSTDNATDSFTFGEEIIATDLLWFLYDEPIPAGTQYICWKTSDEDLEGLYIDDIVVSDGNPVGEWQTVTSTTTSVTLTGLTPGTRYEVQVKSDCDEGEWSEAIIFFTEPPLTKEIVGYGEGNANWYLIASPFAGINPDNIEGMTEGDYDLYRFNPLHNDNEWENYKDGSFSLEAGKGYLYARSTDDTLTFVGAPYSGNGEFALNYDANDEHKCWNLVGNPYNTPASIDKPFYRMNEGGTALSAQMEAGCVVEAMEGVFVQATAAGQSATFTPVPSHEYVDLGLPSGLLWATCNVGAETPEDYGDYFAWGETTPKDTYTEANYTYSDNPTTLPSDHDAAAANWGGGWRMPTQADFEELYNNTTVTWTTQNGVNGRLFTAANGNSLFLPAAGFRDYSSLGGAGSYGIYRSSSLNTDFPNFAWVLYFYSDNCYMSSGTYRYHGLSVRAVRSARQN